jgi:branched-chain amino acid transport system permease protein
MDWNVWKKEGGECRTLVLLSACFILLPFVLPYKALATEVLIFALATVAFDLLLGYTGIMMFCQASFFGTAAYITGILLRHYQTNLFLCLGASLAGAGILALFFGYLATQRSGSYSVLLTLAFNELVFFVAYQWKTLTGGSDGLQGISRPLLEVPGLFSISMKSDTRFYFFALFFFLVSFFLIRRITRSPFGKVLQGIRENETRTQAIGFNTQRFKLAAFVLGGVFIGLAGSLYAMFMSFVDISSVAFDTSGKIVMMELIGGMGTLIGPILGAAIVTLASDIASAYWDRWLLILGAVFVFFVLFARGGVWGLIENMRGRIFRVKEG